MRHTKPPLILLPLLPGLSLMAAPQQQAPAQSQTAASKLNIIFVSFDDMNTKPAFLGVRTGIKTPNMDRLAARGMVFTNAHCAAPICNPSRTAIYTGMFPSTSGVYGNDQWWRPAWPGIVTLPAWLKQHGYWTEGAGKSFHHMPGFNDPPAWSHYYHWSHASVKNGWQSGYNEDPDPRPDKRGWPEFVTTRELDAAPLDVDDTKMPDRMVMDHVAAFLAQKHDKPFFLSVGTFRPHIPLYVPRKYFEMYPIDTVELPPWKADDRDDIPKAARDLTATSLTTQHAQIVKTGRWREAVQAYMASITFADAQLGLLLDALDKSPCANNTIIVAWSDHGWHLGEKSHWGKWSLWRNSTHVPLLVCAPGLTTPGARCNRPVNLVDLYPTLTELAGLPAAPQAEGRSIVPLLKNPAADWPWPSITTFKPGNHSLFGERWHYIRYADGSEELYDIEKDPNEWNNLASLPSSAEIKKEMSRFLPPTSATPVPGKTEYTFDPVNYTWTKKTPKKPKSKP